MFRVRQDSAGDHRKIPTKAGRRAIVFVVLLVIAAPYGFSQNRSEYFDEPGTIVLPENYDEDREYPLLVLLPYTGGTAEEKAKAVGFEPGDQEDAILLLPEGRFNASDYLPDFLAFVDWFEDRLYTDISDAVDRYSIDTGRIYLAGYSLGGDISWALSVRNPEDFAGAIVAGSRSSHPVEDSTVDTMAESGFRAAFLIGDSDTPNRYDGLNYAHGLLDSGDVETMYREYPGGHELPPQRLSIEALEFISDHEAGRITATGSDWPAASGTASRSRNGGFLGLFSGSNPRSGRIRIESDIPVAISSEYETGVGFAPEGSYGIVAETLYDDWWFYGDVVLDSEFTATSSYNTALSSNVGIGRGQTVRIGGIAGWDYVRNVSDGRQTESDDDFESGSAFRRQHLGLTAQLAAAGAQTPRAGLSVIYRIPNYVSPLSVSHLANGQLTAFGWPTDWLHLTATVEAGTRQYAAASDRTDVHTASERVFSLQAGAGFTISDDVMLSLSYRGQLQSPLDDGVSASRSGYNDQWRLGLRYSLY